MNISTEKTRMIFTALKSTNWEDSVKLLNQLIDSRPALGYCIVQAFHRFSCVLLNWPVKLLRMHPTYELVRRIITIAVLAGLAVWLIVHTVRNAEFPRRMAIKWAVTLPLLTLALLSVHLFGPMGVFIVVFC